MKNMKIDSPTSFLVTLGIAEFYERLPLDLQQRIRQILNLHHGTIGVIIALIGLLSGYLLLLGVGGALMLHDRKDAPLWKKEVERIISILRSKLEQFRDQQRQQTYITQARYYLPNRF